MASFAMIWIGTSGFQYPEWKGTFYPQDLSTKKMLGFYAGHFPTTEVNYSFYRIPSVKTLTGWAAETPEKFKFTLKGPQEMTHVQKLRDCRDIMERFWDAAQALREKLGAVLFQLPPFLKRDVALLSDFVGVLPPQMKSAFEFRHASWFDPEVYATLRRSGVALCIADSEKLSSPVEITARHGYFRLRDEGYTTADIERWAGVIRERQKDLDEVYVYFKHEESGIGPKLAKQMMELLGLPESSTETGRKTG
jgi:uncharacterized protein YecE (DUF72 family)